MYSIINKMSFSTDLRTQDHLHFNATAASFIFVYEFLFVNLFNIFSCIYSMFWWTQPAEQGK